MNYQLRLPLATSSEQLARLVALQAEFAKVCNALAPVVQQNKVWNRVALHHLTYRALRAQFPDLGSQMICNAIYSVSRTSRAVFQSPQSPFNLQKLQGRPLPLLQFSDTCPVYFDRHTLSIKDGQLSMFTLDGRMRFELNLQPQDEHHFRTLKLKEIVLNRTTPEQFELTFSLGQESLSETHPPQELPAYVMVGQPL